MNNPRVKYGKTHKSNFSNIFATSVQLIIRMKRLIEGQYKNFEKFSNSDIIPAIIDAYEQMISKQEYLDIDPFIHAMKNEFHPDSSKFIGFLSSVICSIDFSNRADIYSTNRQICFTSLKNKLDLKENENYYFDISFKKSKELSKIIEGQYEFAKHVYYHPDFLFFSPKDYNQSNIITIDDTISLNTYYNKICKYILSIIVVQRKPEKLNHFVLYICTDSWIQIEDDEIFEIKKEKIFKEIIDPNKYRIELFGYCRNPSDNIIPIDLDSNVKNDYYELGKLKQSTISATNRQESTMKTNNQNKFFIVKLVTFDYNSLSFSFKNEQTFSSSKDRDEYLILLEKNMKKTDCVLYFDNGTDEKISYVNCFDDKDANITVYSVYKYAKEKFKKPYFVSFREYFNDEGEIINEKGLDMYSYYFYPSSTMEQLFYYCYKCLPGKPEHLYLKDNSKNYDTLLINDRTPISKIFKENANPMVYYRPSQSKKDTNFNQSSSKLAAGSINSPRSQTTTGSATSSQQQTGIASINSPRSQTGSDSTTSSQQQAGIASTNSPRSQTGTYSTNSPRSQAGTGSTTSSQQTGTESTNSPRSKAGTESQTTQKSYENNVLNTKVLNEKIVIMKPLRTVIYDEKNDLTVKRITINQRSKYKVLNDLIQILISEGSIGISYYIYYHKNYVAETLPKETPVEKLPPNFNIQVKPHRGLPYRICILYRSPVFNDSFNINEECFTFAIKFQAGKTTLDDINDSIMNYLFKGKSERDCMSKNYYQPSIFHDYNKRFIEINDINEIAKNEQKPIFVIWESAKAYDFVMSVINKHLKEEKI